MAKGTAAFLTVAVLLATPALANNVTVQNSLNDTGIKVQVFNRDDIIRLAYCAQITIDSPLSQGQVNSATAPGCTQYPELTLVIETISVRYPYGTNNFGAICRINVSWNNVVTVSFTQAYRIDCSK
ncbi:MAG: hypothetical protein AB7O45_10760 [Alphaproteobacteria bacterium]